jgi:histidine triad (HIT) family protein
METAGMNPEEMLEAQKQNCIFCKIINKEIPSSEIFSDDKVMIILDINPANEGHCLILPKEHYQILPQMPDELIGHMFLAAKRMSRSLLKALSLKGTTVLAANGALAGQKAPHFMIHVIPRKKNDMLFPLPKNHAEEKQLTEVQARLQAMMAALTGRKMKPQQQKEPEHKEPQEPQEHKEQQTKKAMDLDKISDLFK